LSLTIKGPELDDIFCKSLMRLLKNSRFLEKLNLKLKFKIEDKSNISEIQSVLEGLRKKEIDVRFSISFDQSEQKRCLNVESVDESSWDSLWQEASVNDA